MRAIVLSITALALTTFSNSAEAGRPRRVGIQFSVDHTLAAETIFRGMHKPMTMEDVISSRASSTDLMPADQGWRLGIDYHLEPSTGLVGSGATTGFYCFFDNNSSAAPTAPLPSGYKATPPYAFRCPNIRTVARRQADLLVQAGIDYIVIDATNFRLQTDGSNQNYILAQRPIEVLAYEWQQYRIEMHAKYPNRPLTSFTPEIAVWSAAFDKDASGYVFTDPPSINDAYLWLYNKYPGLMLKDSDGKRIIFMAQPELQGSTTLVPLNAAAIKKFTNAGIKTVSLWTDYVHGEQARADGLWTYRNLCKNSSGRVTTSVISPDDCKQDFTTNSKIGKQVSVSKTYQAPMSSIAFQNSGSVDGLTFAKQMKTAFDNKPDWVLIRSWNEVTASPQTPTSTGLLGFAGVSVAPPLSVEGANKSYVDIYGVEFSHAMEPRVLTANGARNQDSSDYNLMKQCVLAYKAGQPFGNCANPQNMASKYWVVHGFRAAGPRAGNVNTIALPVLGQTPLSAARPGIPGPGWSEACASSGLQDYACATDAVDPQGPFVIYANPGDQRKGVYRCLDYYNQYFYTNAANCEGNRQGVNGYGGILSNIVGYAATSKSSSNPRALRRCYDAKGWGHFFSVDMPCNRGTNPSSSVEEGNLGWVR